MSSDGATIIKKNPKTNELEILIEFIDEKLYFGDPPYLLKVVGVSIDTPYVSSISDDEAVRLASRAVPREDRSSNEV